jgi:hypothetical protein
MRGVTYGPNEVEEALVKILMAGEPESRQAEAEQTACEVVAYFEPQIKEMTDPTDMNRIDNPYTVACQLIYLWAHEADVDRRNNN